MKLMNNFKTKRKAQNRNKEKQNKCIRYNKINKNLNQLSQKKHFK